MWPDTPIRSAPSITLSSKSLTKCCCEQRLYCLVITSVDHTFTVKHVDLPRWAPHLISSSIHATAAPAPKQTIHTPFKLLPWSSIAFSILRCRYNRSTVLVIVEYRYIKQRSDQVTFNLKHRLGALMSSRLIPPNVSAIFATVSTNLNRIVRCFTSISIESKPAKRLNSSAYLPLQV